MANDDFASKVRLTRTPVLRIAKLSSGNIDGVSLTLSMVVLLSVAVVNNRFNGFSVERRVAQSLISCTEQGACRVGRHGRHTV